MTMQSTEGEIRPAAVAGAFYPGDAAALRAAVAAAFTDPLGPGGVPAPGAGPRRLLGIVAPHAGYVYSAASAAWAFAEAVAVSFDLDTRKVIPIAEAARPVLEAHVRPDLRFTDT